MYPGDREVDLGRVEVNIGALMGIGGEVEVEAASEEDLKKFPQLVKGYIGPGLLSISPCWVRIPKSVKLLPVFRFSLIRAWFAEPHG